MSTTNRSVLIKTSPSLALIKYWGKIPNKYNIPATTSLAVTLDGLRTETLMLQNGSGKLIIQSSSDSSCKNDTAQIPFLQIDTNKQEQNSTMPCIEESIAEYVSLLNQHGNSSCIPDAYSVNNFPTAAGIASSSSGYAALALGLLSLKKPLAKLTSCLDNNLFLQKASKLARMGSVSASRAVYGGFTLLKRGAQYAEPLAPASFWSNLRILIVIVSEQKKAVSSRNGMKITEQSSPYYRAWIDNAKALSEEALDAFHHKDLEKLGACMRVSYLRMHASAMAAVSPIIYWLPESLTVIQCAEALRKEGFSVWETMDAGPQVKLIYEEHEEKQLLARLGAMLEEYGMHGKKKYRFIVSQPGGKPELYIPQESEQQRFLAQFEHSMPVK
ncbi:MAG TPA: diphosphomevalonate decarboxylase [Spirochaetia bacterium]|nr:diphosphomevalonate decarboxylase [Spirochaetales bacterium]HRS64707.1 diphosphomevalonate decarboxylase [Spirochaetia bacterium]HPD80536.1 diphosphomevalonate decarboxylase [Spirochaetales bacterium]HQG39946.1 diphosphomevalonate decarboxylase [Spirochaetales bacterium]HQK34279.1 diphosphomevalonate decarboxylase [Spirochaetales bacterium]